MFWWIILWLLCFLGWILTTAFIGWQAFLIGILVLTISFPFLTYFVLARENLFWTMPEEGTAKIILKGNEFHKCLIAWKGYTFRITKEGLQDDEVHNWEVIKGKEPSHPLGLQWMGLWPIYRVLEYKFHWTHWHQNGKVKEHDEFLDYVLLKTDTYAIDYPLTNEEGVEDINAVPLGVVILLPLRIGNPFEAVMRFREWFTILTAVARATARTFIAKYRLEEDLYSMTAGRGIRELQLEKGVREEELAEPGDDLREKLWEEFKDVLGKKASDEGVTLNESDEGLMIFGTIILKKGLDIVNINPGKEYREATTVRYMAEQAMKKAIIEADAKVAVAERSAKQRALESGGMHVEAKQILIGKDVPEDIADKLAAYYVTYWQGTNTNAIRDWRFSGSDGATAFGEIAKIMAVIDDARDAAKEKKEDKKTEDKKDKDKEEENE